MTIEMTCEEAYEIYNRVRKQFPGREIPNANVEGQPWFMDDKGFWCRNTEDGERRITVRHGIAVSKSFRGGAFHPEVHYDIDGRETGRVSA